LVRVKTPYGSICGKQGDCQSGERKCQGNNVLICDESGHFQIGGVCDGGCKDGKCQVLCTTGQPRCRDNKILETCNESGTGWVGESCDYACQNNSCVADPGVIPTSTPTPIDCVPGKKTCTGNKGMMECNSKGNGYNYFTCGILCVGGRCLGETITVGEPINPTNCISGEIKCEATRNGGFSEFKCNSSGFWDEILSCASGCYYGRCKQTIETENCLKENERYQEGKCCPGLVKVTSPYGYYCGKPGVCTSGTTKCENNSIWKCDTSGYFSKIKSCDFGCGGNECNFGCFPKSTKCRNEQTLQVCSDDGTAWLSRSCNYCSEGICFSSKKEAEETLAYSDTGWDGEGPLPYCYAPSAEEIGLNTCPQGYVCGAQKVEDRNGLYYCEKKTVENSTVKVCLANSSYCGQGGVLLRCSSDGMRWAAAWQCPAPRPEKGSQYNYSCKQVSTDRGQCRPPTPEEGRDTAVEIAGLTAATVASVLALPAVITNPAIASTAFRIVRIGNAAYAINNAANECQSFESMTNDEKIKCALAAGYALTSTVDAGLAGVGFINPGGSAFLSAVEVGNDVANLALGGVNAYNQCQGGTDRDCYYALISSGIDLVALGVDINQAKQWSKANLHVKVDNLPKENISYQANMYKMTGNSGLSYSNSGMRTPEEIRALETLTEITNEEMRYVIKGGVSVTLFDTQNEMTNYLNKNKNFSFGSNLGGVFFEEETLGGSRWVYDSEGRFIERIDSPNQKKPQIVFALDSPLALGTGFHESIHAQRSGYGIGNDGFYGLKSNLVDFFSNSELSPGARNLAIKSLEEVGTISVELDMYDQIPNLPSEFRSNAIKYQNFNSQKYLQALVDPNSMTPELAKYLKELELTDPITYKMLTADAGSVNANVNANLISKPITIPGQVYGNDPSPLLDELTIRATQLQKEGISKAESVMKSVTEVTNGQYYENYGVGGIKSVPADKAHTVEDLVTCGGMVCRSMTQISTGVANRSGLDAYQGFMTVSKNGVSTGHSFTVLKNADGSISGVIDATNSWTFNSMEDFISRIKSLGYSIDSDIDISSLKSEEVYKIIR
jgi:hypothetical protein